MIYTFLFKEKIASNNFKIFFGSRMVFNKQYARQPNDCVSTAGVLLII
jgi:hypothetical protein